MIKLQNNINIGKGVQRILSKTLGHIEIVKNERSEEISKIIYENEKYRVVMNIENKN